jgi:hypothetical protein
MRTVCRPVSRFPANVPVIARVPSTDGWRMRDLTKGLCPACAKTTGRQLIMCASGNDPNTRAEHEQDVQKKH